MLSRKAAARTTTSCRSRQWQPSEDMNMKLYTLPLMTLAFIPAANAQFGSMMNPAMMMNPMSMGMMNPAMMMAPMSMGMMNPAMMMAPMGGWGGLSPVPATYPPMTGMGAYPSMVPSIPPLQQQTGFLPAIPTQSAISPNVILASPSTIQALPQQPTPTFNMFDISSWMQMFPNSTPPGSLQGAPAAQ